MKHSLLLILIIGFLSCHSTKKTAKIDTNVNDDIVEDDGELEFGCYYPSDTIKHLVFYFPDEKKFYINGDPGNIDELCLAIQKDIKLNKGVKYYLDPQSNFMYAMTIIRKTKKCYLDTIDELSLETYGLVYEELSAEQKVEIDARLTYKVIDE